MNLFRCNRELAVSFRKDYTLVNQHSWLENGPGMKMYFLLKMGMFHCYVSVPEGIPSPLIWGSFHKPSILGSRNLNQSRFHGMSCSRIYVSTYGFMKIRSIHPPKKIKSWNLKITQKNKGRSSEPSSIIMFNMLIFSTNA